MPTDASDHMYAKAIEAMTDPEAGPDAGQCCALLVLIEEQRETNALLAELLEGQQTDQILRRLEDIAAKVFAAGFW